MKVTMISSDTPVLDQRAMEDAGLCDLTRAIAAPAHASALHLTPRQLDVLALLCEGLPNKLIARRLNISGATVKVHIGNILREFGVASRLQAVVAARRLGLAGESLSCQRLV